MKWLLVVASLPALLLDACSDDSAVAPGKGASASDAAVAVDSGDVDGGIDASKPLAPLFAFVGSFDGKIRTFAVDGAGTWTALKTVSVGINPTFLAFDPARHRVVAVDDGDATVHSFAFEQGGNLTRIDKKSAAPKSDDGPTHVSFDPSGRWVVIANYNGGSMSVRAIDESGFFGSPSATRSSGAKSHWAGTNPSGGFVFVPTLGTDRVMQYRLDASNGQLTDNGNASTPAGAGPRHLAFHPTEKWAYTINELGVTVTTYSFDQTTGKLTPVETISALPEAQGTTDVSGAEIFAHPNGKWIYASTRGYDSIAKFDVDPATGKLTRIANTLTGAHRPRSFALDADASLLFAGNEAANQVVGFRIEASGALTPLGAPITVPNPAYVGLARFQ